MKIRYGAIIVAVLAASGIARADVIAMGAVSYTDWAAGSGVCNSSGSSSSSLSLYCGDSTGRSQLSASVGDTSGSADIIEGTAQVGGRPTSANASVDVSLDGLYMLTGGTGYGYASWSVTDNMRGIGCTVSVGGVTEYCALSGTTTSGPFTTASNSFYVPYDTPFELNLDVGFSSASYGFGGAGGEFSYSLADLTPVLTPEPSTFVLLGLGLLLIVPVKWWVNLEQARGR